MSLKSIWERFIQNRPVYQKLRATYERATADLDEARHKQEGTTAKLNEVQHTLNKLEKDHERLRGEYDHAMTDLDKALPALSHSEAKRGALSQQYEQATKNLANVRQNFQQLQAKNEQTKTALNRTTGALDELRAEHERVAVALDKSRHRFQQLQTEYGALTEKNDQTTADLDEARHRVQQLQAKNEQTKTALNRTTGALDELRAEHERVTVALDKSRHRFQQLQTEYGALTEKNDQTTADLDEARHRVQQLQAEHEQTKTALNRTTGALDELRAEHERVAVALDKAQHDLHEWHAKHERTTVELERTTTALDGARTEHEQTKADLRDEQKKYNALHEEYKQTDWPNVRREYDELLEEHEQTTRALDESRENHATKMAEFNAWLEEHEQTTRALDESREEHARKKQDFDKLSEKHDSLDQKYKLVSNLLSAKRSENEAFKKFKELFEGRFMAFANEESSLAEEAAAVEKLQSLEKRLEELVAFPHTFTKKSIAIGGGFSSGKSEFVNSFITKPDVKMPVDIKPATVIPSFVISNTEVSIKGFSRNGATVDIAPAFYRQLSHNFVGTFDFTLKDLMPSITVEVPLREGLEHICLIDTPGYNPAGGNTDHDKKTAAEFLKDRDALIWMIDANAGTIPKDDLEFIDSMELNGLPFYVVLNKADLKPESELEDILNEVKETLEDAGIEPMGICPYSSIKPDQDNLYDRIRDGQPLHDFFRSENKPKSDLKAELKGEIKSVFAMYENAIRKDENTAKLLRKGLNDLGRHINQLENSKLDPDEMDALVEKIDNLIKSQEKDFTSIKGKMEEIKKDLLKAVDEVFWSLRPQSSKGVTRPPSALASKSEQGSPPSRSTVKRQGSIKGGKYIPTDAEQPEKPSALASKLEHSQPQLLSVGSAILKGVGSAVKGGRTDKPTFVNPQPPPSSQGSFEQTALRYINSATAEVLVDGRLGIRSEVAKNIVAYRTQNGPFQQLDELRRVRGIGSSTFKLLRQRLRNVLRGKYIPPEQIALRYINSATAEVLADERLGISPQIAAKIVAYRTQNGPFQQLDELRRVRGIGSSTFERLRRRWRNVLRGEYIPTDAEQSEKPTPLQYLNSATAKNLEERLVISPQIAAKIVAYRTQNGPFQKFDELRRVKGIGDLLLLRQRLQNVLRGEYSPTDAEQPEKPTVPGLQITQLFSWLFGTGQLQYLNSATAKNLEELGISPQIAANIVAYRKQHGPFQQLDELKQVKGIGSSTFKRLRKRLLDKRHSL